MLATPQPPTLSRGPSTSKFGMNGSSRPQAKRPTTRDSEKEQLWIPLLQSASKGKDIADKHLIVLGGTSEQQREFLDQLNPEDLRQNRNNRLPGRGTAGGAGGRNGDREIPISNKYALGYTYQEVMDADGEDVLARLNVHMLTHPSGKFVPLLKPLLGSKTVKDTLVVILLDWGDPFTWARSLRQWVRLLRKAIVQLDDETKIELESVMNVWKERRVGFEARTAETANDTGTVSLGPGEWDEGLGIPMGVVCVQSEKIESLERDVGWGDDQFDFLQQWLRTVLLKHGASLVYTAPFDANSVRALIHSSLSIQSLLKKEVIKHNVIDRDKILIPPNWDSWGKIRILREGFDPEVVGNAWSVEIQDAPEDLPDLTPKRPADVEDILKESSQPTSAVLLFESSLPYTSDAAVAGSGAGTSATSLLRNEETVTAQPFQEFLQAQLPTLDRLKQEDAKLDSRGPSSPVLSLDPRLDSSSASPFPSGARSPIKGSAGQGGLGAMSSRMESQIGPYQINVNGIDFDAEEATRRLREREDARNAPKRDSASGVTGAGSSTPSRTGLTSAATATGGTPGTDKDGKPSNEALHGFFASLIKKGPGGGGGRSVGSGNVTPRKDGVGAGANSSASKRTEE